MSKELKQKLSTISEEESGSGNGPKPAVSAPLRGVWQHRALAIEENIKFERELAAAEALLESLEQPENQSTDDDLSKKLVHIKQHLTAAMEVAKLDKPDKRLSQCWKRVSRWQSGDKHKLSEVVASKISAEEADASSESMLEQLWKLTDSLDYDSEIFVRHKQDGDQYFMRTKAGIPQQVTVLPSKPDAQVSFMSGLFPVKKPQGNLVAVEEGKPLPVDPKAQSQLASSWYPSPGRLPRHDAKNAIRQSAGNKQIVAIFGFEGVLTKADRLELLPGVGDFLRSILAQGVMVIVHSSCNRSVFKKLFAAEDLGEAGPYFRLIDSSRPISRETLDGLPINLEAVSCYLLFSSFKDYSKLNWQSIIGSKIAHTVTLRAPGQFKWDTEKAKQVADKGEERRKPEAEREGVDAQLVYDKIEEMANERHELGGSVYLP